MFYEKLASRWASKWEKLLDYRRQLLRWKEELQAAEVNNEFAPSDSYMDQIDEAQCAIHDLEERIARFKDELEAKSYDPYEVLELPWGASAKEIYQAYLRLHREWEHTCSAWDENLERADTRIEKVIYSTNLEEARFMLGQIVKAYRQLRPPNALDSARSVSA